MSNADCDISGCTDEATKRISLPGVARSEYSLVCAKDVGERLRLLETHADMTDATITDLET